VPGTGALTGVLLRLYAVNRLRGLVLWLVRRLEGPELTSPTMRRIFRHHFGVEIGMYSHGAFFEPYAVDEQTTIGRYCSMARGARIVNHNHPSGFRSTSGIFFNPHYGLCARSLVQFNPLVVGNDVWIGTNAVILPEVNRIGDGAIIGAGAVVSRDVPPYAVVLGNPARIVKYRFGEDTIARLLEEQWWDKDVDELVPHLPGFQSLVEPPADAARAHSDGGAAAT
jgi:acetyltransferase-like isoleucine patch superfamily enzyme